MTRNPRTAATRVALALVWIAGVGTAAAPTADAACNLIPSAPTTYPSTLGEISSPFAQPGAILTLWRAEPAFSATTAENTVLLTFRPPGGPATVVGPIATLSPASDASCKPIDCAPEGCRCVYFAFPDTDALVGVVDDGRGLTGPVEIRVESIGVLTAHVEPILLRGSMQRDPFYPTFVALPDSNDFADFTSGPGTDLLGAVDDHGNLFIPTQYPFVPVDDQYHAAEMVGIEAPAFASLSNLPVESFTLNGGRLPPLILRRASQRWLGTVDAPASVLRLEGGADLPGMTQANDVGPVVIPGVTGSQDARRRAHPFTITTRGNYVIYENRECGDIPAECVDVNDDGDLRDYYLYALDVSDPDAEPFVIDAIDGGDYAGYPAEFGDVPIYSFRASDRIVSFSIQESGTDFNLNGQPLEVLTSGAFDLDRQIAIAAAADSPHMEVDGPLLGVLKRYPGPEGKDALYYYDADDLAPAVLPVQDGAHAEYFVTRQLYSLDASTSSNPFDFAVKDGRIAFAVPESVQLDDLNDDGDQDDKIIHLFTPATGVVNNLIDSSLFGLVRLTSRWLLHDIVLPISNPIAVRDLDNSAALSWTICEYPFSYAFPAIEQDDDMVTCLADELGSGVFPQDHNGDGDVADKVAHVLLPTADGGPVQYNLQMAVPNMAEPHVFNDALVVGVDEVLQGQDLDGDGVLGGPTLLPAGPYVLVVFDRVMEELRSLQRQIGFGLPPFLNFLDGGLLVVTPQVQKGYLRDLDGDGRFEDPIEDPLTGEIVLDDNCPTVTNRDQLDRDADGVGDACEDPLPFSGRLLLLKDDGLDAGKRKLVVSSTDDAYGAPVPAGVDDPRTFGATLRLRNTATSETAEIHLPAASWTGRGKPAGSRGYKFKGPSLAGGSCVASLFGDAFKVRCLGTLGGFTLDEATQGEIAVALETGYARSCLRFGGVVKRDQGAVSAGKFIAKSAPPPTSCEW